MNLKSDSFPLSNSVRHAYKYGEDDETMEPLVLVNRDDLPVGRICDGDYVIFYDIRGEREIELTESFVSQDFPHFSRSSIKTNWATMIEYHPSLEVKVAFPPIGLIKNTLSEVISRAGLRQVKIAESEKQVHITSFMNGKRKEPFDGEDWRIVPSLEFEGYLPPPSMNAKVVADTAMDALRDSSVDFIVVNWANVDVIGHSENRDAILQAVSTVDTQVGRVLECAKEEGVSVLVTADHGTVEKWYYPDGTIDTGHTDSPVPFVLVTPNSSDIELRKDGSLIDIAPTVLDLLNLERPEDMTGSSLICEKSSFKTPARVILLILDGWGIQTDSWGNLIHEAETPVMDRLQKSYPNTIIQAAGKAVGLPDKVPNRPGKTVGNSEVGHMHIGAGRIIPSDRLRIENAIEDNSFERNPVFKWAMEGAIHDGTNLHLLGIISFYSSHGSVEHLKALLRLAKKVGVPNVYIHGMLGRRGEKPESGAIYVGDIEAECKKLCVGQFVSLIGRFWSLDREENWDRIEKTYRWLVNGEGRSVKQN